MQFLRALASKPASLADQWRALLFMALELARQILVLERSDPRAALEKIELLSAWCWMAEAELCRQLAQQDRKAHMREPFDAQLPPMAAILQMLRVFIARVKAGLVARVQARRYAAVAERIAPYPPRQLAPEYIDTS